MVKIVISDVTPAELAAVTDALAAAGREHHVVQIVWNQDEAAALLAELKQTQVRFLRLLVEWDGVLTADALREGGETLRGSTGPITKAIARLAGRGEIRGGLPAVFDSVYDPNNRAFQKVRAYRTDAATLAAFRAAFDQIDG
ncbi:MAG: hypothetical protein WAX14_02965 [Rhodococcus sp. (in: high G+C Gram-positive bacteria)]|uniref:hypothetical protein n=1 Tax=Rhodococcus sp. TaxID=1831 RepID=UPI003BB62EC1